MWTRITPLWCLAAAGCTAPLVLDAGSTGPSLFDQLPDATAVEVTTADGEVLRGARVDAGPDSPLVLHLLPSGASVTTGVPAGIGRIGLEGTISRLRELGWSSLVIDYRGVGDSSGRRGASHLIDDGRVIWREAVRLAGGAADRVVVRAGSLGSLVATGLLDSTRATDPPLGVILVAPVRASSIVRHASRAHGNGLSAWVARTFFTSPDTPDIEAVFDRSDVSILVILPEEDPYLPPDETDRVRDAAIAAGRTVVAWPGDHQAVILRSWGFELDASSFSGRKVDELLPAERAFLDRVRGLAQPVP